MIVCKFGGSNLRDSEGIQKVIQIIRAYQEPVVVVVSAFYGITDYLTAMLGKIRGDEKQVNLTTEFLARLKEQIIDQHVQEAHLRAQILKQINDRLKQLERYLLGIHYIGEIPDFVEDMILSYGERLSSLVLTQLLTYNGVEAEEMLPEDIGLITDGEFGNATVDLKASVANVRSRIKSSRVAVIPGFYGVSPDLKVTLLGRGGSDYSAAAIARCLNADSLDIWKDVDGFMSADPRLVPDSVKIARLSYTEAAELAYFGAKILHPRTVEPLMSANIPVRIFNIHTAQNPDMPDSIISRNRQKKADVIKSVTFSDDFGILRLKGPGVGIKPGILAKVTTELDKKRINIKSVITAQTSINFLLALEDLPKALQLTRNLTLSAVSRIEAEQDLSLIALVGEGILEKHGIAARMFSAVSRKEINIRIISLGASSVAAYFIVRQRDRDEAVREIHREFFGK
jgi:aspartate kinase/aspartokinase/homoserine dehydrogenase 1